MKYVQPMNAMEFAELLLTMKTGETIEFGTDPGYAWPDEIPEPDNVTAWYFARKMWIPEYDSRFILIDYAGGEEAFAIPVNCYRDEFDDDDKEIVPEYVETFFEKCCNLGHKTDIVFVEREDKE